MEEKSYMIILDGSPKSEAIYVNRVRGIEALERCLIFSDKNGNTLARVPHSAAYFLTVNNDSKNLRAPAGKTE